MKTAHDLVTAAKTRIQEISPDEAESAIRAADVLLDVREADEYAAGHIPGPFMPHAGCSNSSSATAPNSAHAT